MAPPIPFFRGRHISAAESDGMLVIKTVCAPPFARPLGTFALYLPIARLTSVEVAPSSDPAWSVLELTGEFHQTAYGKRVELAPILPEDARGLDGVLSKRYRLPKVPRAVFGPESAKIAELVTTMGRYQPAFEAPDLAGLSLVLDEGQSAAMVAGQSYHVTGFYEPARRVRVRPGDPHPVGYMGPRLHVFAFAPDHLTTPCPLCERPQGPRRIATSSVQATSWIGDGEHGFRHLDFYNVRDPDSMVVAQLAGAGGQGSGDGAALSARMVLADLLEEHAYGPLPHVIEAPDDDTPALDLQAWVPFLIDRTPLPPAPADLMRALGARIGDVHAKLNAKTTALVAFGVLVHVAGRTLTLDRRGGARIYLVRGGLSSVIVPEHSLAAQLRAQGQPLTAGIEHIVLSAFDDKLSTEPPIVLTLEPGDRLVIIPAAVYDACDEAFLARGILTPAELARDLPARCKESWAITTLEAKW